MLAASHKFYGFLISFGKHPTAVGITMALHCFDFFMLACHKKD